MPVYSSHLVGYAALNLGQRIRSIRQRNGLSLREVAVRAGCSAARLSEIENGYHVLDLRQAVEIARVLGVPLSDFVPADLQGAVPNHP